MREKEISDAQSKKVLPFRSRIFLDIGFEQTKLVSENGQARYRLEIVAADMKSFVANAVPVVDFDEGRGL